MTINRKVAHNRKITESDDQDLSLLLDVKTPVRKTDNHDVPINNVATVKGENLETVNLDRFVALNDTKEQKSKADNGKKHSHTDTLICSENNEADKENTDKVENKPTVAADNVIQSSAREISSLAVAMDEHKNNLRARGIRLQTSNVMLELALQDKSDELEKMVISAVHASNRKYGDGAISREELLNTLERMVAVENDIIYTKQLCKQRGLNIQALSILTKLMRQNPGDGGEKAINTILGYAASCDIPLTGIDAIKQKYSEKNTSVLPEISRENNDGGNSHIQKISIDVIIGISLTIALLALLV